MSEQIDERPDEAMAPPADGALVHWMERPRLRVGPAGVSATAAGAFLLGVGAAVAALAMLNWLGPERKIETLQRRFF